MYLSVWHRNMKNDTFCWLIIFFMFWIQMYFFFWNQVQKNDISFFAFGFKTWNLRYQIKLFFWFWFKLKTIICRQEEACKLTEFSLLYSIFVVNSRKIYIAKIFLCLAPTMKNECLYLFQNKKRDTDKNIILFWILQNEKLKEVKIFLFWIQIYFSIWHKLLRIILVCWKIKIFLVLNSNVFLCLEPNLKERYIFWAWPQKKKTNTKSTYALIWVQMGYRFFVDKKKHVNLQNHFSAALPIYW